MINFMNSSSPLDPKTHSRAQEANQSDMYDIDVDAEFHLNHEVDAQGKTKVSCFGHSYCGHTFCDCTHNNC